LGELARAANEEVRSQNKMLDSLGNKIENVQESVLNINETLKTTIEKVWVIEKLFLLNRPNNPSIRRGNRTKSAW